MARLEVTLCRFDNTQGENIICLFTYLTSYSKILTWKVCVLVFQLIITFKQTQSSNGNIFCDQNYVQKSIPSKYCFITNWVTSGRKKEYCKGQRYKRYNKDKRQITQVTAWFQNGRFIFSLICFSSWLVSNMTQFFAKEQRPSNLSNNLAENAC